MNCYNLDGIRTMLKKDIREARAKLAAWEKVTYNTKKDGTPYKNMNSNITGANYLPSAYAMQAGEYHLCVSMWVEGCGFVEDEIKCYELVRYLTDEGMKTKTQNYMPKQEFLEQVYKFDLEDIKAAVSEHIEYLRNYIADLEGQFEGMENAYNTFRNAYAAAVQQLAQDTEKARNSTLFHMILDTVKERYPY